MTKTENFNNLSKEFKDKFYKEFPRLKAGQTKTFSVLKKRPDPDNPGRWRMAYYRNVPAKDRIYDPGDDTYKDIAFIESVGENGVVNFGDIAFMKTNAGNIVCRGSVAREQEMYEYLCMCNYRQGKKDRDPNKKVIFKLLDPEGDAKARRKSRKEKSQARAMAEKMSDEEARLYVAAKGGNYKSDMDIIRDRIEDDAEKNASEFMAFVQDKNTERKAVINMAQQQEHISFNAGDNKFVWAKTGKTICIVPRGDDPTDAILAFTYKDDASNAVYEELKRLVTSAKKSGKKNAKSK